MGRSRKLLVTCCTPLLLLIQAGCESGSADQAEPEAAAAAAAPSPDQPDTTRMYMVRMDGLRRPDLVGSAGFVPQGDQTMVVVGLRGGNSGGTLQGHIHEGDACDGNPGRAVYPLEPVTVAAGGVGRTRAVIPAPTTSVFDGNHVIIYHQEGGAPGSAVICGDIPVMVQ